MSFPPPADPGGPEPAPRAPAAPGKAPPPDEAGSGPSAGAPARPEAVPEPRAAGPAATAASPERLRRGVAIAYGLPSFAGAAMIIPVAVHLSIFYSDVVLVPLGVIAVAKAIARAFDAITDPVMGWLTDRTRTRFGRRRPWMALGAPLAALAFIAMFSPPEALTPEAAGLWFLATYVLYYLFHTVYEIAHSGLGPELTLDYRDRVNLFGWQRAFTVLGTLCAAILPGLLQEGMGARDAMFWFSAIFGVLLTLLYWNLVWRVRERPEFSRRPPNPMVPGVRRVMRNRVFRILLAKYLAGALTGAIPGTMMPFFVTYVLEPEHPGRWISLYLAIYFGTGFLFLPAWIAAARRFGKKPAYLAAQLPGAFGSLLLFTVGRGEMLETALILVFAGSAFAAGMTIGPSMQADVIDYDELHTGRRREAQYNALWSFMTKFLVIPSMSLPLAVLAAAGYVPNVEQSETVRFAIRAIFGLAPFATGVIGFAIALLYPISEAVHARIRAGIAAHARGETAEDPLTGQLLPPPASRGVPEETSWFLDHFSPRELVRVLRRGPATAVRCTAAATAAAAASALAAGVLAWEASADLSRDPGFGAVLLIVAAGFATAGALFHTVRLRAALRLARAPIEADLLRAHLAELPRRPRASSRGRPA